MLGNEGLGGDEDDGLGERERSELPVVDGKVRACDALVRTL